MKTLSQLEPVNRENIALTIGFFDGVHRGHQAVLRRVREQGKTAICLTFPYHPLTVLSPQTTIPLLCSPRHKERLVADLGLDLLFMIPFTLQFAEQPAELFLRALHALIPFSHLVLGYDSRLGHRREGTPEVVQQVGKALGFAVEYVAPVQIEGRAISSRWIREAISAGHLDQAKELLGRPVSFYSVVHKGMGHGRRIGYPTANLDIEGICRPPFGVYAITLHLGSRQFPGVANLGIAPTVQTDRPPMLEAHLFDVSPDLYEQEVEVVLHAFLRPERRFENVEALRTQIARDIENAREVLIRIKTTG